VTELAKSDTVLLPDECVLSEVTEVAFITSDTGAAVLLADECVLSLVTECAYASDTVLLADECELSLLTELVLITSDTGAAVLLPDECVLSLLTELVFITSDTGAAVLLAEECVLSLVTECFFAFLMACFLCLYFLTMALLSDECPSVKLMSWVDLVAVLCLAVVAAAKRATNTLEIIEFNNIVYKNI